MTIKWQAVTIIGQVVVRHQSPAALDLWIFLFGLGLPMAGTIIVIDDN